MTIQPQTRPDVPRLCMDARMLGNAGGTGVSSYAGQLQIAHAAIGGDHFLLTDRIGQTLPQPPLGRMRRWVRALWPGARAARPIAMASGHNLLFAPDIFRLAQVYFDVHRCPLPVTLPGPPGIMHWTYPVPLTVRGWRNLYTVHDVIPLLHPALTHIDAGRYRRMLDRLSASASRFIAVSETARDEITRTIGCPSSFTIDCGLAVDATPPDPGMLPAGLRAGAYLLACGTLEKRKNIGVLLAAYRVSGVTLPLVIAGPDGWGADAIFEDIAATPGVIRLPYLNRGTMRALIGHACGLVMPSLAEGFGLPVAEAMALGVPVATSDRGALAETAGGAAIAIDPTNVVALADALRRLGSDEGLRRRLAAAGRANAARFTPARFAERLTQAYATVMADRA